MARTAGSSSSLRIRMEWSGFYSKGQWLHSTACKITTVTDREVAAYELAEVYTPASEDGFTGVDLGAAGFDQEDNVREAGVVPAIANRIWSISLRIQR
jgi:hypothetical protein